MIEPLKQNKVVYCLYCEVAVSHKLNVPYVDSMVGCISEQEVNVTLDITCYVSSNIALLTYLVPISVLHIGLVV